MPAAKGKGRNKLPEPGVGIPACGDVLKGVTIVNEITGKNVRKKEATLILWGHALKGESQREEIFKTQCIPNLLHLLERADADDKFAAMGCIYALAQSEKHMADVVNNKVISTAASLLSGDHDRSKLPAAQLLCQLAARAEYSSKVADVALPALLGVIKAAGPGWGQIRQAQQYATQAIKSLIENIQGESPDVKMARRMALIRLGAIPYLVKLVGYVPKMPGPKEVPAPPPIMGRKGKSKDIKKPIPQGRKDALATLAAACLRFLALCPTFVEELIASGSLQPFITALLTSSDEQAAYIAGVLWEICADAEVARTVLGCQAVPALLHVISSFLSGVSTKRKHVAKKKKSDSESRKEARERDAPAPLKFCEIAVCNAAGALHHLTFLDEAKLQVAAVGGVQILAACMKAANVQTFENAVGALWNVGLDLNNTAAMEAAAAPSYLAKPVPDAWLMDNRPHKPSSLQLQQENIASATFLTQQGSQTCFQQS